MAEHQKYRIIDRIDAGGMAEVFRGVAESIQGFKKNVAIKRILPHLCKNKKFISMFLDEARLSLHLQHANIVGVFDIGVSSPEGGNPGAYFIVMEYVDGSNLKGIVDSLRRQNKRLRVAETIYLMMEVCKGLAYAHDVSDPETLRPLNIVHRDISPPNILMSKNGEVKLVDFGLAKAASQVEQTDPGVVKGKFSYLSPEGASGREVDRRADIFSVGVLLYELLTGKRLFYGETDYQTVELVRQARVPSMTQQNNEVDSELEAVVRRSLARDFNQRYQTAGELQDSLAQYLFSRGLKVTSRDIAQLVRECVRERQQSQPVQAQPKSLIDALIQEEILKFTSIENVDADSPSPAGQLSPDQLDPAKPLDESSFVDTREWTGDDEPTIAEINPQERIRLLEESSRHMKTGGGNGSAQQSAHASPVSSTPSVQKGSSAQKGPRSGGFARVEAQPVAPPLPDPPVVESLEDILEGRSRSDNASPPVAREKEPAKRREEASGPGVGLWIGIGAAVLLVCVVVAYFIAAGGH